MALLQQFRDSLAEDMHRASWSAFPEVVGNWALLRLLRDSNNLEHARAKFRHSISIRKEFHLDAIRNTVTSTTPQEKLLEYDQTEIVHGSEMAKYVLINYNLGWDPAGRIITLYSVVGTLFRWLASDPSAAQTCAEYIVEAFVRRQIQLDMLSRKYGKIIMVTTVVNNHVGGSSWKLAIPGNPRSLSQMRQRLLRSTPSFVSHVHWLKANWALRIMARGTHMAQDCGVSVYGSADLADLKDLRRDIGNDAVSTFLLE